MRTNKTRNPRPLKKKKRPAHLPRIVQLGTIIPDQVVTALTYQFTFPLINAGGQYYAYPFYTNAPYDVNPALGSTNTQGFSEMASLFTRYRVLSYRSVVQVVTSGIYPTMIVVLHRNTNASSAGGSAVDLDAYLGNPLSQHKMIGHAYSATGTHEFRAFHPITRVVGSEAPLTADSFQSLVTTTPTDLTFIEIGAHIHEPTGLQNLSGGVMVNLTLTMNTSFFERKQFTI